MNHLMSLFPSSKGFELHPMWESPFVVLKHSSLLASSSRSVPYLSLSAAKHQLKAFKIELISLGSDFNKEAQQLLYLVLNDVLEA